MISGKYDNSKSQTSVDIVDSSSYLRDDDSNLTISLNQSNLSFTKMSDSSPNQCLSFSQQIEELTIANVQLNEQLLLRLEDIERYKCERQKMKKDIAHYHAQVVKISEEYEYQKQSKQAFITETSEIFEKKHTLLKADHSRQITTLKDNLRSLQAELSQVRVQSETQLLRFDERSRTDSLKVQEKHTSYLKFKDQSARQINELSSQIETLEHSANQTINNLNIKLDHYQSCIYDSESDIKRLSILCNEKEINLQNLKDDYLQKSTQLLEAKEKIKTLTFNIEQLNSTRKLAMESITESEKHSADFLNKFTALKDDNLFLKTQLDKLGQEAHTILPQKLQDLHKELTATKSLINVKTQQNSDLLLSDIEKTKQIEELVKLLQQERLQASSSNHHLIEENKQTRKDLAEITKASQHESFSNRKRLDSLKCQFEDLSSQQDILKSKLSLSEQERGHQDSLIIEQQKQIAHLMGRIQEHSYQQQNLHQVTFAATEHNQRIINDQTSFRQRSSSPSRYPNYTSAPHQQNANILKVQMNESRKRDHQLTVIQENDALNKRIFEKCIKIASRA